LKISIEHATEGMVLSAAVVDAKGRLILPKGEKLAGPMIERLGRFGVLHLDVEDPAAEPSAGDAGAAPRAPRVDEAALIRQIHQRFDGVRDDTRMILIRDAVTRQLVRSGVSKPI
jgi:hypothetical protein